MANINTRDKPRLTYKELVKEISRRVGVPALVADKILGSFEDIVTQCLANGVQVTFGRLGTFTYKIIYPKEYYEWNGKLGDKKVIFYQEKVDGYFRPEWKYTRSVISKVKQASTIPYGSVESKEANYFVNEVDSEGNVKPRIEYKSYMREKHPDLFDEDNIQEIKQASTEDYYDEYDSYYEEDTESSFEESLEEESTNG